MSFVTPKSSGLAGTPQRSFEIVAQKIATMIRAEYGVGRRLPPERDLAARFGVSRPTVREAILSLVMAGTLQVRRNSGAYVVGPLDLPELHAPEGCGPFENLEARLLIEPQIAAIAARRSSDVQRAELEACLAAMALDHASGREADEPDRRFHVVLAETTGNGALVTIADSLWRGQSGSRIWQEIHAHMAMERYRPFWLQDHADLLDAVGAGNPRRAAAAMVRHLNRIRSALMDASTGRAMGEPD